MPTGPHARRPDAWNAVVSYHADTAGGELTQLVNVIFGNTSMKENAMVMDVDLPQCVLREYPGPRFGVDGLRHLLRVPEGPLVMTALKPMGLSSQELAEIAYGFAKGGIDRGVASSLFPEKAKFVAQCLATYPQLKKAKDSLKFGYKVSYPGLLEKRPEAKEVTELSEDMQDNAFEKMKKGLGF